MNGTHVSEVSKNTTENEVAISKFPRLKFQYRDKALMRLKKSINMVIGDLDIAVVHGNFFTLGGGERVATELARTFDAPLYYGFGYPDEEPDDIECLSLFNDRRFTNTIKESGLLRNFYYMREFQCVPELHEYDVVIQSGNEPGWYLPPDEQVVVKYTHSTPRDAYDCFPEQAPKRGRLFELTSFLTQTLYLRNLSFPDLYVANSEVIARRLDRYWDKKGDDVKTVYPPVEVDNFGHEHAGKMYDDGEYYLVLDRLVERKHIDEVVDAFVDRPESQLIIAGSGPQEAELHERATDCDNVEFLGYVSEAEKRSLLAGANALLYAAEDEDFGIVPIEALASGTPVIGPREGFTQYQIQDGVTGVLFDREPTGIESALRRFEAEGITASPAELEQFADQFGFQRFRDEMHEAVETAILRARVTPKIEQLDVTTPTVEQRLSATGGSDD